MYNSLGSVSDQQAEVSILTAAPAQNTAVALPARSDAAPPALPGATKQAPTSGQGSGQIAYAQDSQLSGPLAQVRLPEQAAPIDRRAQLVRATVEMLVVFAFFCIVLILLAAGISVFYILTRPRTTKE